MKKYRRFTFFTFVFMVLVVFVSCSSKEKSSKDEPQYEDCTKCKGKGRIQLSCNVCNETGFVFNNCSYCKGKGVRFCYECQGRGYDKCSWCSGAGKKTCLTCQGEGYRDSSIYFGENKIEKCSHCNGRGYEECFFVVQQDEMNVTDAMVMDTKSANHAPMGKYKQFVQHAMVKEDSKEYVQNAREKEMFIFRNA